MNAVLENFKQAMEQHIARRQPQTREQFDLALDECTQTIMQRIQTKLAAHPEASKSAITALEQARRKTEQAFFDHGEMDHAPEAPPQHDERPILANDAIKKAAASVSIGKYLIGGVVGLIIGAVATYALQVSDSASSAMTGPAMQAGDIETARQSATVLKDFVDRLEVELNKPNSAIQVPNGERFVNVAPLWRDEYNAIPVEARYSLSIRVRKVNDDYKILINSPLCTAAAEDGIFQQDPRRPSPFGGICDLMAVWTDGVESF